MEKFASFEATVAALVGLGFVRVSSESCFFDSPKECSRYHMPVVQAYVHQCSKEYWCVELDGEHAFNAPCVWNGPKADWDHSNTLQEFTQYLDNHYPGWR